jgi:predicted HicB family RNase H-like nuclease
LEDYSGQFKLRTPRSLHRSLAEHSKKEGISMNQYCVYLLSKNDADSQWEDIKKLIK